MKTLPFLFVLCLWAHLAQAQPPLLNVRDTVTTVAFGSCANQNKPQPIWEAIAAANPDVFVFLGDNVYGDTHDMRHLQAQYDKLGAQPGFAALRQRVPVLATWDDHDYGTNDCGRRHPEREQSKQVFLDFFQESAASRRRTRPGIYDAYIIGPVGRRVQFIVLDERTFRTEPVQGRHPETDSTGNYTPQPEAEMLGEAQWQWLDEQLRQPAEIRIICSSTQFVSEFSGYELWALYPREKERMLKLINRNRAGGVIFISGDVHVGEISRQQPPGLYPIWDVTSSGLTEVWRAAPPNQHRQGSAVLARNFGLISINWNAPSPIITLEVRAEDGTPRITRTTKLSELQPPATRQMGH